MNKSIQIYIGLILMFACGNPDKQELNGDRSDTPVHFDLSLLQGPWWWEGNSNSALFQIVDDSLYYTDEPEFPYYLQLSGNKVTLKSDSVLKMLRLEKLTKDSLVFYDSTIHKMFVLSKLGTQHPLKIDFCTLKSKNIDSIATIIVKEKQ